MSASLRQWSEPVALLAQRALAAKDVMVVLGEPMGLVADILQQAESESVA